MDSRQFDELTRDFAIPSRRGVLAAAATVVLAALVGRGVADDALARRKRRKAKNKKKQRQHHRPEPNRVQASAKKKKKKGCKGGTTKCGKRCVSTANDAANCGACGNACGPGRSCQNSVCVLGCGSGEMECGDTCADLQTDSNHCGTCEKACESGQGCSGGDCVCDESACVAAGGCCDGNACEPIDTQSDPDNCGACGTVCAFDHASALCESGTCALGACDARYANCDDQPGNGCEINTLLDDANCGACGNACSGDTPVCNGSGACACGHVCASGCRFTSVQAAVDAASPGDTILLCAGTWVLTSTVVIDKDLTLIGAGVGQTILDGNDAVRDLRIASGAAVTVQDLAVTKGKDFDGGGIFNEGTLTLADSSVTANTAGFGGASGDGGGISNLGTLTLIGTSVSDNTADEGGGIHNFRTVMLKDGSSVSDNAARINGGGISNWGTLTLKSSSVTGNFGGTGGGLANWDPNGEVTLEAGSSVTNNTGLEGGGIFNRDTVTLKAVSRVTGNKAQFGGGINNSFAIGTVTLEADDIVTDNHLMDATTLSNCAPINTIANCIG